MHNYSTKYRANTSNINDNYGLAFTETLQARGIHIMKTMLNLVFADLLRFIRVVLFFHL